MAGYGWVPPSHCSGTFHWVPSNDGSVPPGAVQAGQDGDGGPLFVGRAFHQGDVIPCKVSVTHGCAYLPFGGQEVMSHNYEVLVSRHIAWQPSRDGEIPSDAIRIGQSSDGEPLYAGRVMHEGTFTPGKVHPSHKCLYIPYGGEEIRFTEYEIMILI
ncbi:hypothetical protein GE061_015787 [Apolygus lucorum]|uniref:Natterin-3 n=1 Tax=Apolygus lucorum TaxID=248454 RepID=A0A6A4J8G4_APOLU|nr:hypothetical protein GE061_015787 [Apolygus lucorum]